MTLNSNWSKESGEERTEEYRSWRTKLGIAGVTDVDQIEWRFINGHLTPVAVIEIGVADMADEQHLNGVQNGSNPSPRFFEAVEGKISIKRPQGICLRLIANTLNIPLLTVVFIKGEFNKFGVWVHYDGYPGWAQFTLEEYRNYLREIPFQPPIIQYIPDPDRLPTMPPVDIDSLFSSASS